METCEHHKGLVNFVKKVDSNYNELSVKVGKIDGKVDVFLNQSQATDPCAVGIGIKARVDALKERVDILDEFKNDAIREMSTQTSELKTVKEVVGEIKTDVKKLVGADTKYNIYWGITIAIILAIVNFGIPLLIKALSS